jgi:hypothetical protein
MRESVSDSHWNKFDDWWCLCGLVAAAVCQFRNSFPRERALKQDNSQWIGDHMCFSLLPMSPDLMQQTHC